MMIPHYNLKSGLLPETKDTSCRIMSDTTARIAYSFFHTRSILIRHPDSGPCLEKHYKDDIMKLKIEENGENNASVHCNENKRKKNNQIWKKLTNSYGEFGMKRNYNHLCRHLMLIAVLLSVLFFVGAAAADTADFSVKLNGGSYVINGEFYTFTADVTPADSNASITWKSENPAVASVDADGHITGNSVGHTVITVTAAADGMSVSDSIAVEVFDFVPGIIEPDEEPVGIELIEISDELNDPVEPVPVFASMDAMSIQEPVQEQIFHNEPIVKINDSSAQFDLRNVNGANYVSGVRYQGKWGTCYMFGAMGSIESNLIMNGYADSSIDLSELQGLYYIHRLSEVTIDNPQLSLKNIWGDPGVYPLGILSVGGSSESHAFTTFMLGVGLVDEKTVPYVYISPEQSANITLDPSYATEKNIYTLVEYIGSANPHDVADIKKLLKTYGAAKASVCVDPYIIGYENPAICVYYKEGNYGTNHAVSIVGWDDNFPKEYFPWEKPKNDGAWLIKNTYGSAWGNMGGYYWLSYEDGSLAKIIFSSAVPADTYEYIYQYDGVSCTSYYYSSTSRSGTNKFTAESDGLISAVSFKTEHPNFNYRVSIQVNGIEKSVTEGHFDYAGYRHVVLNTPVWVHEGESFDVKVALTSVSGNTVSLYFGNSGNIGNPYGTDWAIKAYAANTTVAIPVASSFVYNGKVQTAVLNSPRYTLSGTVSAVNAGSYTAVATLTDPVNYAWSDGSTGTKQLSWSIARKAIAVPTAAANLVYTGSVQTGVQTGTGYTLTGNTATNAGSYTAVATLTDPVNYAWSDGSTGTKQLSWSIARKAIAVPTAAANLVYTGSVQTGVQTGTGYTLTGNTATNAGSYTAVATLTDPVNYAWSDGSTGTKQLSWSIARKAIAVPTAASFVYTGSVQTGVQTGTGYTLTGNTATNAGSYTAVATLTDPVNYAWSDGSTGTKQLSWSIARKAIAVPTAASFVYTGSVQTGVNTGTGYTLSGTAAAVNAGEYTVLATPDANHIWSDGTTSPKTLSWTIAKKAAIAVPTAASFVYGGNTKTGVKAGAGYTLSGTVSAKNVGSYTAVATLTDPANYTWSDGTTSPKTLSWTIAKKAIPVPDTESFVYSGYTKTGVKAGTGYTLSGTAAAVNAGEYTAFATPDANHIWSDGSASSKPLSWSIEKVPVSVPVAVSILEYNGEEQTVEISGMGSYTLTGTTGTDVGVYAAAATLTDTQNFIWADGNTEVTYVPWAIIARTIVPEWSKTLSFMFDGSEHTCVPEITNRIGDDDVSLVMSDQSSGIQSGRYLSEITGLTGADAKNYCIPVSLEMKQKIWKILNSGDGLSMITELKETGTYDGGKKFTGTVSLDGLNNTIAASIGFTINASDASISISDIKPADAKSGWQYAVNSETNKVVLYGGTEVLTGKIPLVTFTACIPYTAPVYSKIKADLSSLSCGTSLADVMAQDISDIVVVPGDILHYSQGYTIPKLTVLESDPPVINADTNYISVPVYLENAMDVKELVVVTSPIPGAFITTPDEELPGISYSAVTPTNPYYRVCIGSINGTMNDSYTYLFTLTGIVTDPSLTHVSVPVTVEKLNYRSVGEIFLDPESAGCVIEFDLPSITADVSSRSLIEPVIEQKPFNAETRAEIVVSYLCQYPLSPELCDKADCFVPYYKSNPSAANGTSLYLPEYAGFETYVKDTDYTYNVKDGGSLTSILSFSDDRKGMQSDEETFVFRSEFCLGDVDQNGEVDADDVTYICDKLVSSNPGWTAEDVFYGRLSGGAATPSVLDALYIAKYTVGLVDADYNPFGQL